MFILYLYSLMLDQSPFLILFLIHAILLHLNFICMSRSNFSVFYEFLVASFSCVFIISSACDPWPVSDSSLVPKDGPEGGAQTHPE